MSTDSDSVKVPLKHSSQHIACDASRPEVIVFSGRDATRAIYCELGLSWLIE